MDLLIKPSHETLDKAKSYIKIMDATQGAISNSPAFLSKVTKNLKTIKPPVIRFFEAPGTISTYFSEGEYDLVAVFKFLKYESFFLKATQKKLALATKSGFGINAENDEVTEYFDKRFLVMMLATGLSLDHIIKTLLYYLIVCSNAFLIKVRDKDFEYASSYKKDGKEMHPVVGYFLAHPTTIKPRFKYVKDTFNGHVLWKWEIESWVQTNRKGQMRVFPKEDVIHFTLFKEDGMILGMPDVIPVIDDIRTLRKIEEDIQLLIYRDLFPIIHYKVETPRTIDHASSITELDRAKSDMQHIVQDGGIATDARHTIEFVGSNGKSLDVQPYLEYFKSRVWVGLGVSPADMAVADSGGGEAQAQEASKALMDTVKFLQQELSRQFEEQVLTELFLQSPFSADFAPENRAKLLFQEIDIEWKIRQENHEADLFSKGTKTIHEVRNKRGDKTLSDEDLMYTHPALFGATPPHKTLLDTEYGDKYAQQEGKVAHATTVETVTKTSQPGAPAKKTHTKPIVPGHAKSTGSAAKRDSIKSAGTNSNIVKKKAQDSLELTDAQQAQGIKDRFTFAINGLKDENKSVNKLGIMFATKSAYDEIKSNMKDKLYQGIEDAYTDLGLDYSNIKIQHDIFSPLDKLRDDVSEKLSKDSSYVNKGANRLAITNKTEQSRAYNYGYSLACLENNINKFVICTMADSLSSEGTELLGKEISVTRENILEVIPPFHPNSNLTLKCVNNTKIEDDK